ncbi:hypothetical protein MN032_13725 [Agromyces atrinae]|uniref:hypothetical protein n=1 Tax=Agromyces atrinae TaxID=592376 RepID=UPI001F599F94|nr:hypothetical protein [Agromyces atrinae]MCI2958753.1 hypothetical protein [Agromyces atrinae]
MSEDLNPNVDIDPIPSKNASLREQFSALPDWSKWALLGLTTTTVALIVVFSVSVADAATARDEFETEMRSLATTVLNREAELKSVKNRSTNQSIEIAELKEEAKAIEERAAELDEIAAQLATRENKVGAAEAAKAANSFGNGVHVVGSTVSAGTYSTTGPNGSNPVGCYYAWMSGVGSDADIVDNNIVSGPAVVNLSDGEVFESSSCAKWERTG